MSEVDLIHESKNGVISSFEKLVALYQTRLYSFLLVRCHNQHDADDILQETFIRAYKYIKSYNAQWAFSTWLFTIARKLLIKSNPVYFQPFDDNATSSNSIAKCNQDIDSNNLWKLIKKHLNKNCYDALWFYYMEGFSIEEISSVLNKSQSWVKTNLHRSKMKLSLVSELRNHLEMVL